MGDLAHLGKFPDPGERFVLLTVGLDRRLAARSNITGSQQEIVEFLRAAADDLAAGLPIETPGGLVVPS